MRTSQSPRPSSVSDEHRAAVDARMTVDLMLSLRPARDPSRKLPLPLRRLMPEPMKSLDDWRRLTCEDIADMSKAERSAESFRWKVAVAMVEPDDVPPYVPARIEALDAA
jgi:hypothetical protein